MPYTIGLDFGTGSVRGVVVDIAGGQPVGSAVEEYGVYTQVPGTRLPIKERMYLADAQEYLAAMEAVVRAVVRKASLNEEDIVGIGVDTTSLSMVTLGRDGAPLSLTPAFTENPHAFLKLWKSHSAEREAAQVLRVATERGEPGLAWNGGTTSSEWLIPKALETFHDAPEVFAAADLMLDLSDYVPYALTGCVSRNAQAYAYKAMAYDGQPPSEAFLEAIEPGFGALRHKLRGRWVCWGDRIGGLTAQWAQRLGLRAGIAVSAGAVDGSMPLLSLGLQEHGDMLLSLGTSAVLAAMARKRGPIAGCTGCGMDVVIPGMFGCECGISALGDLYDWVARQCVPAHIQRAAEAAGMNIHAWLACQELARPPKPNDVMALDWWNGHRGPLPHRNVTGVFSGMTLGTTAGDLYRAAVEATAFCTRMILDNLASQGLPVKRIAVCGGIARKNPVLVQLFCDVLGQKLLFSSLEHEAAVGAAFMAANAADSGKCADLSRTIRRMAAPFDRIYSPDRQRHAQFTQRYARYLCLAEMMQAYQASDEAT